MTLEKLLHLKDYADFFEKEGIQIKKQCGDITFWLKNKTYIAVHKRQHGGYDGTIYLDTNIFPFGLREFRRNFTEQDNIIGYIIHECIPLLKILSDIDKYSFEECRNEILRVLNEKNISFVHTEKSKMNVQAFYSGNYEEYIDHIDADTFVFYLGGKKLGIGLQPSRGLFLLEYDGESDLIISCYFSNLFTSPTIPGDQYIADVIEHFLQYENKLIAGS